MAGDGFPDRTNSYHAVRTSHRMKALEASDSTAQAASVAKKKALRDAPAASAITNADTIAKLKAAWDTSTLGDSPYA